MNIQGIPSPMLGPAAPASSMSSTNSANSGTTLNPNNAESMFIKLLAAELQSQDPTQAMDPTQMVGQMFQMNQLQQLIDINQTLSNAMGTAPSGHSSGAAVSSNTTAAPLYGVALPNAAASYAQNLLKGAH